MKTDHEDLEDILNMFNKYLMSLNESFFHKYYFNFYYPYIEINNEGNVVIRMSINSYRFSRTIIADLPNDDILFLHKVLPIYYSTYDADNAVFDVYKDELIKMMNNNIRKEKLNRLCSK